MEQGAINTTRILRIFKKIPFFSGLLDSEYQMLLGVCRPRLVAAQERLFERGDFGDSMYIILSGEVEVLDESETPRHRLLPGEVLGEIALISPRHRRTAAVQSRGPAVLMELDSGGLEHLLAKAPRVSYLIMRNIAEVLAGRLLRANQELEIRSASSIEIGDE